MRQSEITVELSTGGHITFNLTELALTLSTGVRGTPLLRRFSPSKQVKLTWTLPSWLGTKAPRDNSVSQWMDELMYSAYEGAGIKRARRLRVLVNPYGGTGKGAIFFSRRIEPILRTAGCIIDVTRTTHSGHAYEIAKELPVESYDVLVTVSGDGLIHEVMNGFANHSEPRKALSLPIAPVPCGSGNGLSLNLLGERDGFDIAMATLNVIKGLPMPVDAFSVVQNNKRTISFMSQALGLMADIDLGTEHLRWMGDTRFTLGFIYGILLPKQCPVRLSYKGVEGDKDKMVENFLAKRAQNATRMEPASYSDADAGLPPLLHSAGDKEGWTTVEEPLLYIYAGKGPYVARDYMAFPVSLPDDGLIDIVAMPLTSRSDMFRALSGVANGESFWFPKLRYIKAHAYRIELLKNRGYLSVDGEAMPFEDFQVEVHAKLATLLSLYGHYVTDFPRSLDALDTWIASPSKSTLFDTVSPERLSDLYITLPTRDGVLRPFKAPQESLPVEYGHHLIFFHPRTPESMLRTDGTDPVLCPPNPFTRRMWAGGRFEWNNVNPLLAGSKATAITTIENVAKKGFEDGKPMVFIDQKIEIVPDGCSKPSLTEIRSHVYLPQTSKPRSKPREVKDIPHKPHFSFTYRPTLTTLFRFSALTFNAHHIHLDKDMTQSREGYPGKLPEHGIKLQVYREFRAARSWSFNSTDATRSNYVP
ncbi:hypothetical protein APHAL10511_001139 [Amanita phalloides]|nr:hypothetical protein APHAL10511_001139 [Amanita phalloides]